MWIARDKDETLWLFGRKPVKGENSWDIRHVYEESMELDSYLFPEVQWEDENPTEVEFSISIKQKG